MWILKSNEKDGKKAVTFRLPSGAVKTIGRAPRADFIVDAAMVSRVHCRLSATGADRLELKDLRSTNGTFVNGRRVEQAKLAPGDLIRIGRIELAVSKDTKGEAKSE
jgi:pSer/pThr/pTyr-binding forkhead associated (FHA) protein